MIGSHSYPVGSKLRSSPGWLHSIAKTEYHEYKFIYIPTCQIHKYQTYMYLMRFSIHSSQKPVRHEGSVQRYQILGLKARKWFSFLSHTAAASWSNRINYARSFSSKHAILSLCLNRMLPSLRVELFNYTHLWTLLRTLMQMIKTQYVLQLDATCITWGTTPIVCRKLSRLTSRMFLPLIKISPACGS